MALTRIAPLVGRVVAASVRILPPMRAIVETAPAAASKRRPMFSVTMATARSLLAKQATRIVTIHGVPDARSTSSPTLPIAANAKTFVPLRKFASTECVAHHLVRTRASRIAPMTRRAPAIPILTTIPAIAANARTFAVRPMAQRHAIAANASSAANQGSAIVMPTSSMVAKST